jgi:DNA-binding NarL/FixJ family response regulator
MAEKIECVFLTCFEAEYARLATILQYSGIRCHRAETLREADFYLTVTGAAVLVTDVTFLDGTWRDALRMIAETHPVAPPLVTADEVDWPFLADVYELGAGGILWKPVDFTIAIELIQTVDQAARDRAEWYKERVWSAPVHGSLRPATGSGSPFGRAAA